MKDRPPRDRDRDRDHLHVVPADDDTAGDLGRTPPHDLDAEQAVLGALLHGPTTIDTVTATGLDGRDFYRPAHELLFDTLVDLHTAGTPTDPITVVDHLRDNGTLNRVGGPTYLHDLYTRAPLAPEQIAPHHAGIVTRLARRRRWLESATRIGQYAHTGNGDIDTFATEELERLGNPTTTGPEPSTWQPVDLDDYLNGTYAETPPVFLARADGACLLYAGAVHSIAGEPESGKTWVAVLAVVERLAAGQPVLYVDFEDRPQRIVQRLLAAGATPTQIRGQFRYLRPETALNPATRPHLAAAANGATLAILDGVTEAMTLHGLELNDNTDVARFLELLPRRLADTGAAVLQIDHVIKDHEKRGRYAIGGQHKLAGIDGCAYKITVTEPFARGRRGHARITLDKDREGHVRAAALGHTVATLTLDSRPTEHHDHDQLRIYLDTPQADTGPDGGFRPTGYMTKVSTFLLLHAGANKKAIETGVKGKAEHIRAALQALINEGYVRTEDGPNRQLFHHVETPFMEDDE